MRPVEHPGHAAAADLHLLGRLVDGARPVERRRFAAHTSAGQVHRRALFTEHEGDTLAASPARAGDQGHLACETLHRRNLPRHHTHATPTALRRPP